MLLYTPDHHECIQPELMQVHLKDSSFPHACQLHSMLFFFPTQIYRDHSLYCLNVHLQRLFVNCTHNLLEILFIMPNDGTGLDLTSKGRQEKKMGRKGESCWKINFQNGKFTAYQKYLLKILLQTSHVVQESFITNSRLIFNTRPQQLR